MSVRASQNRRRWIVAAAVVVALIALGAAFLLLHHAKAGRPGILLYGPLDVGANDRAGAATDRSAPAAWQV